jgi:hypothetical protein
MINFFKRLFGIKTLIKSNKVHLPNGRVARVDEHGNFVEWVKPPA